MTGSDGGNASSTCGKIDGPWYPSLVLLSESRTAGAAANESRDADLLLVAESGRECLEQAFGDEDRSVSLGERTSPSFKHDFLNVVGDGRLPSLESMCCPASFVGGFGLVRYDLMVELGG